MDNIFEEFGLDIRRILAFAWAPYPNLYDISPVAKKAKTPPPPEEEEWKIKDAGETIREPIECMQGIGVQNRIAQAGSIRARLQRGLSEFDYAVLVLRYAVFEDDRMVEDKLKALHIVKSAIVRDSVDTSWEYADKCCRQWGKMPGDTVGGKGFRKLREYYETALQHAEWLLDRESLL